MRSLRLRTRFREGILEGDACLLVFDTPALTGSLISEEVRDVLDHRPNTPRIYLLAPYLPYEAVETALADGAGLQRAGALAPTSREVAIIGMAADSDGSAKTYCRGQSLIDGKLHADAPQDLPSELIQGWLFDLFDTRKGRVDAPVGVHFGKASGRHSDKFLRTSNVLLTSAACAVLGFFALGTVSARKVRRMFVDTAPLMSVAFALQRVAVAQNFWREEPTTQSFSSYGGVDALPRLGFGDLVLISASTSGSLAKRLLGLGVEAHALLTLYQLGCTTGGQPSGRILYDLTYRPQRTFGYTPIENHPAESCELCKMGYVLAELEGDQFLLERRDVKRLRVGKASQTRDSREAVEHFARKSLVKVRLHERGTRRTDIELDAATLLGAGEPAAEAFSRLLIRHAPSRLDAIVLMGMNRQCFDSLVRTARLDDLVKDAKVVLGDQLGLLDPIDKGNALVVVDYLVDHATLRGINALLRSKVPGGCVAYLSGVTIADSARNLADLRIFLSYGEHGAETFTFRSAMEFMLPLASPSSWAQEFQLLRGLASEDGALPKELAERMDWLQNTTSATDGLFLRGLSGEIAIARDFVFLDTSKDLEKISQADVYAVVSNVIAAARCNDKGLHEPVRRDQPALAWTQNVYAQVVLCPSNFRDFNDAVLRGALLRAARPEELNYAVDDQCSAEMLDILCVDLDAWPAGRGDSLPEFLLALATRRLRLRRGHLVDFRQRAAASDLPDWLKVLATAIQDD